MLKANRMQHLRETDKRRYNDADDEIDLMSIIRMLQRFFKRVWNGLRHLLNAILAQITYVILAVALGLGIAYALYSLTKPFYTSSMTLMLANIRSEFIEDEFNKLSDMILEKNSEAIATRLNISTDAAQEIKEMSFYNVELARMQEDSIMTAFPFRIELSLFDRQLFDTMEVALVRYLGQNKFFARQKKIKQQEVENMITKLKSEIASIDSMKTNVSEPRGPVSGFVYGQPVDPTNLYKESISMYKQLVRLEAERERLNSVQVISSFVPRLRPTGPSLKKYLGIGGLIGLMIGGILALNLESRRKRRTQV